MNFVGIYDRLAADFVTPGTEQYSEGTIPERVAKRLWYRAIEVAEKYGYHSQAEFGCAVAEELGWPIP